MLIDLENQVFAKNFEYVSWNGKRIS